MKRKQLSLIKGAHRFLFRYREGQETELLAALLELAADPKSPFDFLDAAVLSFQMGRRSGAAESLEAEVA